MESHCLNCWYWTSHEVHQFELLAQFLYDTVQEDGIDPACLTWIDNVTIGNDSDLYCFKTSLCVILFKMCLPCYVASLEEFVNNKNFSINYILQLDESRLKEKKEHLG